MGRDGQLRRPVERGDQVSPLAGLRDAELLGAQHPRGRVVAVAGEQAGEQRPKLEDGRAPAPARSSVAAARPPSAAARRSAATADRGRRRGGRRGCRARRPSRGRRRSHVACRTGQGPCRRSMYAWQGRADQPPGRRELGWVERGDVGFDPLVPGGARVAQAQRSTSMPIAV